MDRYQKIKKIGEGSFGKAFLVKSKRDGQQYVIKEINIVKMSKKERDEARKEVALLAQMKHPNIVTYRESFEETGSLYICMDFCDAGDLYGKINAQRGILIPEDQVLDWFVQICFAVKYIHDRKILHRDIKSQNIFLTKHGEIKLGDFGIAKVLNSTVELARTCIGTPYYLSPEICENRPYNNKSDIWSLGCVLYEITTLKHAFEAGNMKNLVFKIVRGSYPPVSSKYSYELRNVIAALFKRNPRDRPSVNNLLRKNFLIKRVEKFMGNEIIAKELGHTVMHGQKMAKDIRALPPAPASRPGSARSVADKRPESARPTPRYDPAAVYGAPAVRRSKENVARKSRDASRKSADADKKRAVLAAAAVANNDIAKKRRELVEKERARRVQQKDNEFAAQHKALLDKQRVARINKAREEGWKGLMESLSSNEEEKSSSSESRAKTPQQPVNRNIPSPKPVGGVPQGVPVNERGRYEHYHDFLDKIAEDQGDRQRVQPKNYMNAGPAPQAAARQAYQDQQLAAKAAGRARVVEEFMNRKREAAYYKARGQAQKYGAPRPDSARSGAGEPAPKRQWAEIDARNQEEKEYLARLKQIRLQNFNERRSEMKEAAANKPGVGVKGAINADGDERRRKIEALKAQADERAKKLKEQLEIKRREAYEKEKQALKERAADQRPLFPVEPPKKVEPAPVIPITQVMAAIGAKHEVETSIEKSPLQKKKDEILRRVNEKPRPKWGKGEENVPDLALMELEETASGMEATSVSDSVVKLPGDNKPKEERKKWGEPDPEVLPSARKQWGGMHESLLHKLSEADIQATVTIPAKGEEGSDVPGVGETIIITKQPPTPRAQGTITISKEETKSKENEPKESDIDASELAPGEVVPKAAGSTITISDKLDTLDVVKPKPRPRSRSRSPSPQLRQLPELKPGKKSSSSSDSDDAVKAGGKSDPTKRSKSQLSCLKARSEKKSESVRTDETVEPESTVEGAAESEPVPTKSEESEEISKPEIAAKPSLPVKPALPPKPDIPTKSIRNIEEEINPPQDSASEDAAKPELPAKQVINARTVNLEVRKEIEEEDEERAERMTAPDDDVKISPGTAGDEVTEESITELPVAREDESESPPVKQAWDSEKPTTPVEASPEKSPTKLKESLKKESPKVEKGPTEVNKSQEDKLFDKVELEEEEEKVTDDMKVEEYEEEESNSSYQKTLSGMKLGLTIGHFDLQDRKMLRTCSLPDLSKLFKTMEEEPESPVRFSLDLPSPSHQEDEGEGSDQENDNSDDGEEDEDEDEDLANVMQTMESILLDRQDSKLDGDIEELSDLKGSGSDSGDEADRDSGTTSGGSSFINTMIPGKEEWCSDDDDDNNDIDEEDIFCRLEESRAQLEAELGCDRFLEIYKAVQAAHEDEDESIEEGEKIALEVLGDKGHLYSKIIQLVLADGAYSEDND